jgi:predicted nucleic acid-binding protein
MADTQKIYCFDTNVLVQGWNHYYAPEFCHSYWDILNTFGERGIVFIPREVYNEIQRVDDGLSRWLKSSKIPVRDTDGSVTQRMSEIFNKDKRHHLLVDDTKQRSMADPWVIAHALQSKAVVVTKENKETNPMSKRIKIPNVCEKMGVECINDFEFIRRFNINFSCSSPHCF